MIVSNYYITILNIKSLAFNKTFPQCRFIFLQLNRATVQNPVTGKLEHAQYRVSKSAWLTDAVHPVVARVCKRIEDITGLSMSSAEELQVWFTLLCSFCKRNLKNFFFFALFINLSRPDYDFLQ